MSGPTRSFHVLFVCTGNTCRSPLAAAAFRAEFAPEGERITVESAGTSAFEGQPISQGSLEVAASEGIDLSSHRAHRVTRAQLDQADLVLVMEPQHRAALQMLGAPMDRVKVLSMWPEDREPALPVSDPFGASREAYEECWRRIRHHVRRIAPEVRRALLEREAS